MCTSRLFLEKPKHFQGKALCLKWGVADTKEFLPPLVFPPESFLKEIGNSMVTRMVLHHHTLLQNSSIAHMYPKDEDKFLEGVTKAAYFLIESLGGEKFYSCLYGAPKLCRSHAPFVIDDEARLVWLDAYKQTLHDLDFPKHYLEVFWNWLEPFSLRMVNQRLNPYLPKRIVYEDIKAEFGL